jgi:hypothetical protein
MKMISAFLCYAFQFVISSIKSPDRSLIVVKEREIRQPMPFYLPGVSQHQSGVQRFWSGPGILVELFLQKSAMFNLFR